MYLLTVHLTLVGVGSSISSTDGQVDRLTYTHLRDTTTLPVVCLLHFSVMYTKENNVRSVDTSCADADGSNDLIG